MEGGRGYKKGLWKVEEDRVLMDYVKEHGTGKWNRIAKVTGSMHIYLMTNIWTDI